MPDLSRADRDAVTALSRFGLGPRPGDLRACRGDPRGALMAEIAAPQATVLTDPALIGSQEAYSANATYQRTVNRLRRMGPAVEGTPAATTTPGTTTPGSMAKLAAARPTAQPRKVAVETAGPPPDTAIYEREIGARLARAGQMPTGFSERLVMFWSNHFAVSLKDATLRSTAGSFEREAIRPHVLGRFADMLKAVERHPAMLAYLDNNQSIGPNSDQAARNSRRGLNENLARETLELHTLGVDGGYTQADVTALARILTGWTIVSPDDDGFNGGRFTFAPARHEPGDQTVLGRSFAEDGVGQGEAVLDMLARHPATARHIARSVAVHFVADEPPPELVDRLAARFRDTDGDLAELARTLVLAPEAWDAPATKMRSPQEFVLAAARLTGRPSDAKTLINQLTALGQPVWNPGSPKGYSDRTDEWLSPTGLSMRLDVADQIARASAGLEPLPLLDEAFGPLASEETVRAVRRAESRAQGVALVLMSPEFQRR